MLLASIRDDTPPPIGPADGLATLEMIEAAQRSIRLGRRVALAEVRQDG